MSSSILFARHEHHELPDGQHATDDPLGFVMYLHIFAMGLAFGILYPVGMIFGLARSKWHVPTQITASCLAIVGFFLGHAHKGRQYSAHNIHSRFAKYLLFTAIAQVSLGVVLKLHIEKGLIGKIRRPLVIAHLVIAIIMPAFSWVQMGFGAITITGFCHEDHLGQCLAHGIMGSSFIAYGLFLLVMLFVGERMLDRQGRSQEFYDNLIITLWGIVNTFTEHRWGQPWNHKDYQHTAMGIIWWCAGMVGLFLSRNGTRNHIPALVMIFTGYAMSQHSQNLEISTKVHAMFGLALTCAGAARIVEISFVLRDRPHRGPYIFAWQYLPPFLLVESGMLFMGATEEQMSYLHDIGIMHSSYILILTSVAFLIFLLFLCLVNLYVRLTTSLSFPLARVPDSDPDSFDLDLEELDADHDDIEPYRANQGPRSADTGARTSPERGPRNPPIIDGDNGAVEMQPFLSEDRR